VNENPAALEAVRIDETTPAPLPAEGAPADALEVPSSEGSEGDEPTEAAE
jgi:hypothetical protein